MATQGDYTAVANALVAFAMQNIRLLPTWEQNFIPLDKLPAAAGAAAKVAVDTLDDYRSTEEKPT
jgi:hypothetical protein